jgi:hypothetical protein
VHGTILLRANIIKILPHDTAAFLQIFRTIDELVQPPQARKQNQLSLVLVISADFKKKKRK